MAKIWGRVKDMDIVSIGAAKASWQISQDAATYTTTSNYKPAVLYLNKKTALSCPP
ncbi:hypothetical protein [Microbulbifer sp. SSSA005]|uniref:hypothetical protein n=1 Tax=unclassified Microbulbifer TaxID=2619833 RepID=UPI00403B18D6